MIKKIDECYLTSLNKLASNFNLKITNEDLKKENEYYVGYFDNEKLIAFINYSIYYERAEINQFEIKTFHRNCGKGQKLLKKLIEVVDKSITLEVRKDNISAIRVYEKLGFKRKAIRKNYYDGVDGILMERVK